MSSDRPFLTADAARAQADADLDAIDAALNRLRKTSTDLVGNAFRVEMAERLERQLRTVMGLSYRTVGEIVDPPDGAEDPALPAGVKVRDLLCRRLRIMPAEVRRRAKLANFSMRTTTNPLRLGAWRP
jgi:outer membrane protein TolC